MHAISRILDRLKSALGHQDHDAPAGHQDAGGASPGEAIADDAAGPHAPTTPSNPAEVVTIDPER